jgi:hypothetical protein
MKKPVLRYVSLYSGRCGLTTDSVSAVMRREGSANVKCIRHATERDVAWIAGMGGRVPDTYRIVSASK